MNLKYDEEFYNHVASENENELNCSVPFHPAITSKVSGKLIEICNNSEDGMKALTNYDDIRLVGSHSKNRNPCAMMDINFGLPHIDEWDNPKEEAYIKLYMDETVKVKTMILYYDSSTLAAEIGGYVGILIGISLMDLTIKGSTALIEYVAEKLK